MFSGPGGRLRAAVRLVLFPAFLYLIVFAALTYPLILRFSTHLFADLGDGIQHYWNLWWMHKSIVELRAPFWSTPYLHYPYGTSLLGHTLNPFNGFLAILLLPFLTLLQAYNVIVVFSFVAGGVTAFLLSLYVTRSYWPSVAGGAIFTFSNYHFAHAEGHMNLISLEWIPLFALLWLMLLERPRLLLGLAAGLTLFAIALCDYYYLMYSVLFGGLAVLWRAAGLRDPLFLLAKPYRATTGVFLVTTLATSGALVLAVLLFNARDPLLGGHSASDFSVDLLAPFIPGGHWRFAELTAGYWSSLPGFIHESSVHIGLSLVALLAYVWVGRARVPAFRPGFWYLVLGFFAVLSLGPALQVWGQQVSPPVLPYAWLEVIFPPLAVSGVPVRMMVMVMMASSVIAAMGLKMLFAAGPAKRWVAVALLAVMVVEYLPAPVPMSELTAPEYVRVLGALEDDGKGVFDTVAGPTLALYYQTVHEKPMALGVISRLPRSVAIIDVQLWGTWERGDYEELRRVFGIRYLVTGPDVSVDLGGAPATVLYEDAKARLWDLGK